MYVYIIYMEPATILAIIALATSIVTGIVQIIGYIKKSDCGCIHCESHNNIEDVLEHTVQNIVTHSGDSD